MTTLAVTIGHACTDCGECEVLLPGLRAEVKKCGSVFANPYNPNVNWEGITEAMQKCPVGALNLQQVI